MSRRLLAVIAASGLLLGGCLPQGPATRFYLLTPSVAEPAAESKGKPLTVLIREVRVPRYLDRREIVTRDAGNALAVSETEHWGGDFRDDLARVLAVNLGRLLPDARVLVAPYPASGSPDRRIEVDIRAFERQPGGRVELSAQWWIVRGGDNAPLATADASFGGEPAAGAADMDGTVRSMSVVYGELAQAIARDLRATAEPR